MTDTKHQAGERATPQSGRSNEQIYFDALKRIASYQSVEQLRKHSDNDWGLSYEEALEMAYENIVNEARSAVRGRRRPKMKL